MATSSTDYRSLWSVLQSLSSSLNTTLVSITSQPALYAALIQLDNDSMGIPAPGQGATEEQIRKYNRKSGLQLLNELALAASSFDDICDRCQEAAATAAGLIPSWSAIPAQAILPSGNSMAIDLAPYISSSLQLTELTATAAWASGSTNTGDVTLAVNGTVLTITTAGSQQAAGDTLLVTVTAKTSGGSAATTFPAITAAAPSISALPPQVLRAGESTTIDLSAYVESHLLPVTLSVESGLLAGDTARADGTKLVLKMQGEAVRSLTIRATTLRGYVEQTMSVTSANPPTISPIPDVSTTTSTETTVDLAPYISGILTPTVTAYGSSDTVTVDGTSVTLTPAAAGERTVFVTVHTAVGTVSASFKVKATAPAVSASE